MLIFDWKARRAGDAITISGRAAGGSPARITGVTSMFPRNGRIFALDRTGDQHELVLS